MSRHTVASVPMSLAYNQPLRHGATQEAFTLLQSSFIHMPGVGPATERSLWDGGTIAWDHILDGRCRPPLGIRLMSAAAESAKRFLDLDAAYFFSHLPSRERWRLYCDFVDHAAFLDIETTGLSADSSIVTVVGILDRRGYTAYVRGDNLDALPEALSQYRLFVTFNGACFDLPFLDRAFRKEALLNGGSLFRRAAHIDLLYVLRQLGLRGGLKRIERALGVGRPSILADLDGFDAVRLWRMADEGEPGALDTLVRYNAEDVMSLPRLASRAVADLAYGLPLGATPVPEFPECDISALPFDDSLVRYLAGRKAYRLARR